MLFNSDNTLGLGVRQDSYWNSITYRLFDFEHELLLSPGLSFLIYKMGIGLTSWEVFVRIECDVLKASCSTWCIAGSQKWQLYSACVLLYSARTWSSLLQKLMLPTVNRKQTVYAQGQRKCVLESESGPGVGKQAAH